MPAPREAAPTHPLRLPPLWLALACLSWGLLVEQIAAALVMVVTLELAGRGPFRWALTTKDFQHAADLTAVCFGVMTVYQFSEYSLLGIYRILALLPFCLYPLLLMQIASAAQTVPTSALAMSIRRRVRHGLQQEKYYDLRPAFVMLCIVSASTGKVPSAWFSLIAAGLVAGLLLATRPARYRLSTWLAALALTGALGYLGQVGFVALYQDIADSVQYWFNQFDWYQRDPNRTITAIGSIGQLKLSDQIRVRVKDLPAVQLPLMLSEASYQTFRFGVWSNPSPDFAVVDPAPQSGQWWLAAAATPKSRVEIIVKRPTELGLLPLPAGTTALTSNDLIEVQRNGQGTVRGEARPGLLRYIAQFEPDRDIPTAPQPLDRDIPPSYRELLARVAHEIGLPVNSPPAAIARLEQFFAANFRYSLVQEGFFPGRTPLASFLLHSRRGHCEYFATATVLLLRQAGISARYVVGYDVQEYSPLEQVHIARARHAHAWAVAYVDGHWRPVDTTPAVWFDLEEQRASHWQTVQDLGAWLGYRYSLMRRFKVPALDPGLLGLVPVLAAVLLWRMRQRLRRVERNPPRDTDDPGTAGAESALWQLVRRLEDEGRRPQTGETLYRFLSRQLPQVSGAARLGRLVRLHYALRFGAWGLTPTELAELRAGVAAYLARS